MIDKVESLCELRLVKGRKDSLNQFRFLLSTQTIYLLVGKERAQSNHDDLSDCRCRRELLPDGHSVSCGRNARGRVYALRFTSHSFYGAWICTRGPSWAAVPETITK